MTLFLLMIFSLATLAFPLYMEVTKQRPNLLEPVLLFNYGFFASYPFKGILLHYNPALFAAYPDRWSAPPSLFPYLAICWVAITLFNLAYYAVTEFPETHPTAAASSTSDPAHRYLFLFLIVAAAVSAVLICTRINFDYRTLTSLSGWERLRATVMVSWQSGGQFFIIPIFVGVYHVAYEALARPAGLVKERIVAAALTAFVVVVLGSRAMLLSWIISLLVYQAIAGGGLPWKLQISALVAMPLAGGALGIIQHISTVGAEALKLPFPMNIFHRLSSSYEQFENLVNMLNRPYVQFDWGYSIFEDVFLTYIPRQLLPSKPLDYGFVRAQNVLFGDWWTKERFTTYPVGSLAELYFNFDYNGIIFGMVFLGLIVGVLRRVTPTNPLYLAPLCVLGGAFLSPHRWYGVVFSLVSICFGLAFLSRAIVWTTRSLYHRAHQLAAVEK